MTDDEFKRAPIANASLSLLLLFRGTTADIEKILANWVSVLREGNRTFEVIVVEPRSEGENAKQEDCSLTELYPETRVIHVEGKGLGALLCAGLAEAKESLVAFVLADSSYQPADLKKFFEVIDAVDLVTGVRNGRPIPWWLRTVDFCYAWFCQILFGLPIGPRVTWLGWHGLGRRLLARWLFGVAVHDPGCMFCLVRRAMLVRMVIQSEGSFAPIEFLAKANFLNGLMDEVPVSFANESNGPMAEEVPTFLQQAFAVFREPDFGPAKPSPRLDTAMAEPPTADIDH